MKTKFVLFILFCIGTIGFLKADEWQGTGFALNGKYVITSHYVVDGAKTLLVRGIKGDFSKMYNAVVVAKDELHDMAIISIEDSSFTGFGDVPYILKSELKEVGEKIYVLGLPLAGVVSGLGAVYSPGIISSCSGYQGEVAAYQISTPTEPNYVGSPIFDVNGDVVGIHKAKSHKTDSVSYAIKSPYMRLFIQNSIGKDFIPTNRKMVDSSLVAAQPFVYIIYASNKQSAAFKPTHIHNVPQRVPAKEKAQIREYKAGDIYKIGDVVRKNGELGVVFEVTDGGKHGKMISAKSELCHWQIGQRTPTGAKDEYNGAYNMAMIKKIEHWREIYPAFKFCADLGEGWYLPAKNELSLSGKVGVVEKALHSIGAPTLSMVWSSTECSRFSVWFIEPVSNQCIKYRKKYGTYVRAVCAF